MASSISWADAREIEEMLFRLGNLRLRLAVIRRHAWHESYGSWAAVYDEATAMEPELDEVRAALGACYDALTERIRKGE
jgi:hypothetical protein